MKKSLFWLSFFFPSHWGLKKRKNDPEISQYVKQVSKDSLKFTLKNL